ncbi:MAG TPA: hypothetical protein VLT32_09020 [Candidatus Sulfomarinibacteraceae bacterium]|nr:hypothetical protein [Candidatus Sulfomarinibacteraceae bacterium]
MRRFIITSVLIFGPVTWAAASEVIGPIYPVSAYAGDEANPAVAYHPSRDESLVVWQADNGTSLEIRGRFVGSDGMPVGAAFVLSDPAWGNDQFAPDVAYDPTHDRYVVVWIWDYSGSLTDTDLVGRIVPATGPDPAWAQFTIYNPSSGQWSPSVAVPTGVAEFMVAWADLDGSNPPEIQGRRMASDGSGPVTPAFSIAAGTRPRAQPDLVWNSGTSQYLVVYEVTSAGLELDVAATRLTWAGSVLGSEFGIADWPGEEHRAAAASCGGASLVIWEGGDNPFSYIYLRPVDGAGAVGPVTVVNDAFPGEAWPAIACDPDSGLFHSVRESVYPGGLIGVAGAVHAPTGQVLAEHDIRPVPADQRESTRPAVAVVGQGRALAVWEHEFSDADRDIEARFVDLDVFNDGFDSGGIGRWDGSTR